MVDYNENGTTKVDGIQKSWYDSFDDERSILSLVDIYETSNEFVLNANMPGVSKENVHLKLEDNSLSIFGKINFEDVVNKKYVLSENAIGNYHRVFRLSNSIDTAKIDAKYENGRLVITLPKHDRVKPKIININ